MESSGEKVPWYAAGLAFECVQCGRCCAGPEEGYVWVSDEEIAAIAVRLGIDEGQMRRRYVRKVRRRWSLIERRDNRDCIFLQRDGDGAAVCAIYDVRPTQCRTWPFWRANLRDAESWSATASRCRGVNRGRVFAFDEIENRREATDG